MKPDFGRFLELEHLHNHYDGINPGDDVFLDDKYDEWRSKIHPKDMIDHANQYAAQYAEELLSTLKLVDQKMNEYFNVTENGAPGNDVHKAVRDAIAKGDV